MRTALIFLMILIGCKSNPDIKESTSQEPQRKDTVAKPPVEVKSPDLIGVYQVIREGGVKGNTDVTLSEDGKISGANVYQSYAALHDSVFVFSGKQGKSDTFLVENRSDRLLLYIYSQSPGFQRAQFPKFQLVKK